MVDKSTPPVTRMPEVVVTAEAPHPPKTDYRPTPKRLHTEDKVVDPGGAIKEMMNHVAQREEARGHEGGALAAKLTGNAAEIGINVGKAAANAGPMAPIAAASQFHQEVGKRVIDHLHDENLIIEGIAKKTSQPVEKVGAEYKRFEAEMNVKTQPQTTIGNIGGHIGRFVGNTVAGGDAWVEGGRPIDRFKSMKDVGGSVAEYQGLEATAHKHNGSMNPNDYTAIRGHKDFTQQTIADLDTAVKHGGNSGDFLKHQKANDTASYLQSLDPKAKKTGRIADAADSPAPAATAASTPAADSPEAKALTAAAQIREDFAAKGVAQNGQLPDHQLPGSAPQQRGADVGRGGGASLPA